MDASIAKPKRTAKFNSNNDVMLASAYVKASLDAVHGTDQDGLTYWIKIRDGFVARGGFPSRTVLSLKARWNKVINAEVAKYIGYLTAALREYKSGWQHAEYTNKAKEDFQRYQGKVCHHKVLYKMLKHEMTKYDIPLDPIDQRVARGLIFLDNITRWQLLHRHFVL